LPSVAEKRRRPRYGKCAPVAICDFAAGQTGGRL